MLLTVDAPQQADLEVKGGIQMKDDGTRDDDVENAETIGIIRADVRPFNKVEDSGNLEEAVRTHQ